MATKKLQIVDSLIKQAENADTLDGKHADEFAAASDVETLKSQVGDESVSEQINAAITNKVDKVVGTAGNAVVFGADGTIADSGKTIHKIYIVPYYAPESITEEQKTEIYNAVTNMRTDNNRDEEFSVYIKQGANLLPAQANLGARECIITTINHDDDTYKYKIRIIVNDISKTTTSKELFFVGDIASNSTSNKAPSAKAVVDYVANNAVDPERIEAAVDAAIEEAKASGEINGKDGESGVYVGDTEPTDPDVNVWIKPNGNVTTEQWVFTLEDGTEVTKEVYVK